MATNLSILSFLIVLMMDHYRANYNMQMEHVVSYLVCGMVEHSGSVLVVYPRVRCEWTSWAFHTLYWMPDAFEIGAFSLLPMFFAQIIYANEWKSYWSFIKPIYITFMCTICSLQLVWAIMAAFNTDCFKGGISGMHPVAINHDVFIDEGTHVHAAQAVTSAAFSRTRKSQYTHSPNPEIALKWALQVPTR